MIPVNVDDVDIRSRNTCIFVKILGNILIYIYISFCSSSYAVTFKCKKTATISEII